MSEQKKDELSLHDVMMLVNIIDLSKRREKFSENEISEVDGVIERIAAFVELKKAELADAEATAE